MYSIIGGPGNQSICFSSCSASKTQESNIYFSNQRDMLNFQAGNNIWEMLLLAHSEENKGDENYIRIIFSLMIVEFWEIF